MSDGITREFAITAEEAAGAARAALILSRGGKERVDVAVGSGARNLVAAAVERAGLANVVTVRSL